MPGETAPWTGASEIRTGFGGLDKRADSIVQFGHNHDVEVDGDVASGTAYLDARYAKDGRSLLVAGCYDDRGRRTDARWLISVSVLTIFVAVPPEAGWAGGRAPSPDGETQD